MVRARIYGEREDCAAVQDAPDGGRCKRRREFEEIAGFASCESGLARACRDMDADGFPDDGPFEGGSYAYGDFCDATDGADWPDGPDEPYGEGAAEDAPVCAESDGALAFADAYEDESEEFFGDVGLCGASDATDEAARGEGPGACDDPRRLPPRELGRRGEDAACSLLVGKDYIILERNWRCPAGEADIVALDDGCLVFVEVKTRAGVGSGLPEEAVTARKRLRYERIAGCFLSDYDGPAARVRFDVVGVLALPGGRALVRHVVNAFGAGE